MEIALQSAEFCLKDNHPLSLRSAKGLHITCTAGTLWITITGKPEDIFLTAGDNYQLPGNGLAIVESIGLGRFRLDPPNPQRPTLTGKRFQLLLRNRDGRHS